MSPLPQHKQTHTSFRRHYAFNVFSENLALFISTLDFLVHGVTTGQFLNTSLYSLTLLASPSYALDADSTNKQHLTFHQPCASLEERNGDRK